MLLECRNLYCFIDYIKGNWLLILSFILIVSHLRLLDQARVATEWVVKSKATQPHTCPGAIAVFCLWPTCVNWFAP